jgi:hypothetical protein
MDGQASGQQLEEAKTINKSLSALGLVRTPQTDNAPHVSLQHALKWCHFS